jgi:DNA-binding NarL/FixJ family response regulator
MPGPLDHRRRTALRTAAQALAAQDGRGIPRAVVVDLAAPGSMVALHAEEGHVLAIVEAVPGSAPCFAALSPRERDVAALLAAGASNAEIAEGLVIALGTAKDHVHAVLQKTGLRSRAGVAAAWHAGGGQSA